MLPRLLRNGSGDKPPTAAHARKEIFLSESCFVPSDDDALRGRTMHGVFLGELSSFASTNTGKFWQSSSRLDAF